jgi:hypothetical protein
LIVIEVETCSSGIWSNSCAHFALRDRVVRIVTDLGRQVEGDAQTGLSLPEQVAITLIGFLRRGEARVLAHRPEARAVHRRLDTARIGIFARKAKLLFVIGVIVNRQWNARDLDT